MSDPGLEQTLSFLRLKRRCVFRFLEKDLSYFVPEIALREPVADVCLDARFEIRIFRALGFQTHRVRDALEFACRDLARPRLDNGFKRAVWNEGIDERAIQCLGGAAQGIELDCSGCFRFSIDSTVVAGLQCACPSCAPVMPRASRSARTHPLGGALNRSMVGAPEVFRQARPRALLRVSLFIFQPTN